jgi:hypothetical protein
LWHGGGLSLCVDASLHGHEVLVQSLELLSGFVGLLPNGP